MQLIKFEKDGCVPCNFVQNKLDELGAEVKRVNAFEEPALAGKFDIASVPTLILVDDNEEVIGRSSGYNPDEIEEIVASMS